MGHAERFDDDGPVRYTLDGWQLLCMEHCLNNKFRIAAVAVMLTAQYQLVRQHGVSRFTSLRKHHDVHTGHQLVLARR
jgi:hypothetical protein